ADVDFGRVPILLAAIPQTRTAHDLTETWQRLERSLEVLEAGVRQMGQKIKKLDEDEARAFEEVRQTQFVRTEERIEAENKVRDKYSYDRKLAYQDYLDTERDPRRERQVMTEQSYKDLLSRPNSKLAVKEVERAARLESNKDRVSERYDLESRV